MFRSSVVFLSIAVSGALSNPLLFDERATCSDVHIFVARGNDEPYPGRQGALTDAICSHFSSCAAEHVEYDNPSSPACNALTKGAQLAISQITTYNQACPDSTIVLTGYSQGGQTMGDVLGGGGGQFWDCVEPTVTGLDPNSGPGARIAAALLWGDARHTAGQSYNVLSGAGKNGMFPRSGGQLSSLGKWASRLRSYCVDTDPICAGGSDGHTHETYFDINDGDAAEWVAEKVGAFSSAQKSATGAAFAESTSTGSDDSMTATTLTPDMAAATSTDYSDSSESTFMTTTFSDDYATSTSEAPFQSTDTTFSYFYPVMASNTMPASTTYSTAPSSTPAPDVSSAATTTADSPAASSTNAASPAKQIPALMIAGVMAAFAL